MSQVQERSAAHLQKVQMPITGFRKATNGYPAEFPRSFGRRFLQETRVSLTFRLLAHRIRAIMVSMSASPTNPKRLSTCSAIIIGLLVLVPFSVPAQSSGGPALGVVEYLEGDVKINGVPGDFGDDVAFGDWVQTGPGASVDIVFDRSNVFRLGENTVAEIEIGASRQSVDLKLGSFAAVFDRLRTLSGTGTFDVRTQTVAGGVRGTSFFLRVLDRDTTYVCTCNGSLDLDPAGDGEQFTDTAVQHSAHFFRKTDDDVVVETAPEIYHSTESLNDLADVIGVRIPWGSLPERK